MCVILEEMCYSRDMLSEREGGVLYMLSEREKFNLVEMLSERGEVCVLSERGPNRDMLPEGRYVIRERVKLKFDTCYPREEIPPAPLPSPPAAFCPAAPPCSLCRAFCNISPTPYLCHTYLYPSFFLVFVILTICVHGRRLRLFSIHNHVILILYYCYYNNIVYLCCVKQ